MQTNPENTLNPSSSVDDYESFQAAEDSINRVRLECAELLYSDKDRVKHFVIMTVGKTVYYGVITAVEDDHITLSSTNDKVVTNHVIRLADIAKLEIDSVQEKEELKACNTVVKTVGNVASLFGRFDLGFRYDSDDYKLFSLIKLLKVTQGVIAGSAALWLAAPFCEAKEFNGDIDICIQDAPGLTRDHDLPKEKAHRLYKDERYHNRERKILGEYVDLAMERLGYARRMPLNFKLERAEYDTEVDESFKYINTVHTYVLNKISNSKNAPRVQVIYTSIPPTEMVGKFDFTICQTYWDGKELYSNYPEHIKRRVFKNLCPKSMNKKTREAKYVARGFKAI